MGRKTTEAKCYFHQHHIKGTDYERDLSLLTLTLITWLRRWLSAFSIVKLLFPSFLYCVRYAQPPLKDWGVVLHLREEGVATEIIWHGRSVYSIISWYQDELMDIYFILWFISQYYFINFAAQIVPTLAPMATFQSLFHWTSQ